MTVYVPFFKRTQRALYILLLWMNGFIGLNAVLGQDKLFISVTATPFYQYARTQTITNFPDLNGGPAIPVDVHVRLSGVGYSLGILARYALSTRWSVSSGIWFNYVAYKQPTITTNPFETILSSDTRSRNFQIPLLVNYQLSTKRVSPYFSGGVVSSLPATTIWPDGSIYRNPDKSVHFYPTLGAGILYQLRKHISLIAQPRLTYILPTVSYITYKNYQFGFQAQLMYKFR